jgi:type III pantothenate kinase
MIFAADIGNSHIRFGLFDGPAADPRPPLTRLIASHAVKSDAGRTCEEYAALIASVCSGDVSGGSAALRFDGAVISSVVPSLTAVFSAAASHFLTGGEPVTVGPGVRTGLDLKVDSASSLGGDIVADAVGALDEFAPPLLIADLGTATTVTRIDANGALSGVAILPGLRVACRALSVCAAELPDVSLGDAPDPFGRSTAASVNAGTVWGAVFALDGYIERVGFPTVVLTGGSAPLVAKYLKNKAEARPDLSLCGLCRILRLTSSQPRRAKA